MKIPRGTYAVEAVTSIRLRSHVTVQLSRGAILLALPNAAANYAVLRGKSVTNVRILGGTIRGERAGHLPPATGEWGMGIDLRG